MCWARVRVVGTAAVLDPGLAQGNEIRVNSLKNLCL